MVARERKNRRLWGVSKKQSSRFTWKKILSGRDSFVWNIKNHKRAKVENKKSQQHQEFPSGLPSKYYPGPMLLNFSDRTRTGVFNMVWPLTERRANICPHDKLLSTTCICILHMSRAQHYLHLLNANTFADFGNH